MIDGRRGHSAEPKGGQPPAVDDHRSAPDQPLLPEQGGTSGGPEQPVRAAPGRSSFRVGERLVRVGVTANEVTVLGMLIAGATGVVIGMGHLWVGVVMVTVGGLMDTLDGVVAKAAGTSSKRGAFFDSVADRVADALIFGGVAWYLASGPHPREALLPFAILGVSAVISYERAKAESLGYDAKGGLMERAERLILLGLALALNVVLVPLLWLLLALSVMTAAQRFAKVWRQASLEPLSASASRSEHLEGTRSAAAWRRGRVESRWRAWRQPRAENARRWATSTSRARARRRSEPLGTRLRRVLTSERSAARQVGTRSTRRRVGSGRSSLHRRSDTGR